MKNLHSVIYRRRKFFTNESNKCSIVKNRRRTSVLYGRYITTTNVRLRVQNNRTIFRPVIYHLRFIIRSDQLQKSSRPPRTTRYIAHAETAIVIGNPIIAQPNMSPPKTSGDISLILLPVISIDARTEKLELVESAAFIFPV